MKNINPLIVLITVRKPRIRIHNDILQSLDKGCGVIMVMFDLSTVFDTTDHGILVERFQKRVGVEGNALNRISDYHIGRRQF